MGCALSCANSRALKALLKQLQSRSKAGGQVWELVLLLTARKVPFCFPLCWGHLGAAPHSSPTGDHTLLDPHFKWEPCAVLALVRAAGTRKLAAALQQMLELRSKADLA